MGDVKTYDASKVIITFNFVPLSGYADGEFLSITSSSPTFTKEVGADGKVSRSKSNDNTSEVAVTLKQSSQSNDYLSLMHQADKKSNLGKGPLSVTDLSGTTLCFWPEAWIKQTPDQGFSKENGDRVWTFDTGNIGAENVGGNL